MNYYPPSIDFATPKTLGEALKILTRDSGRWSVLAGGTDLLVALAGGRVSAERVLNIWNLNELKKIRVEKTGLRLGALVTYTELQANKFVQKHFPLLVSAARNTGAVAIQNRGTLGGNIANASPAADSPPALLAYGASVELVSKSGVRLLPFREVPLQYKKTAIRPEELIQSIFLPWPKPGRSFYRKVGTRKAQAISKVALAARAEFKRGTLTELALGFASLGPTPLRFNDWEKQWLGKKLDAALVDKIVHGLEDVLAPIDDMRSTKLYRLTVAQNLTRQFLEECL